MIGNKKPTWKAFKIFEDIDGITLRSAKSGIDLIRLHQNPEARTPFISRTEKTNGYSAFVSLEKDEQNLLDGPCVITIGLDTQTVFFQPSQFITGQNIHVLSADFLDENTALFLVTILGKALKKFSWGGNGATLGRLFPLTVLLPVDHNNQIDWPFMSTYIGKIKSVMVEAYLCFAEKLLDGAKDHDKVDLQTQKWAAFFIEDVFDIYPGKRLTKAEMIEGNIPFIGSIDRNNGITAFVSNINSSIRKNVLGVNYNGSVAECFYHPYSALFSDDVKQLSFKDGARSWYEYLFVKTIILQQKGKYTYGYKFNSTRMRRQRIMMPVDRHGKIDYRFMRNYMKQLVCKNLKLQIDFLKQHP